MKCLSSLTSVAARCRGYYTGDEATHALETEDFAFRVKKEVLAGVMAASWGRLEAFDKDLTDWTAYCEVVEQYFAANEVTTPAKQIAVLLCSMGAAAYTDLKNAVAPKLPKELKLEEITAALGELYEPPTTVSMERLRFNNLSQQANQRVIEFVSALRQATKCSFLDGALRDRFVCGIRDTSTQKLLCVEDLTFDKAQKMAFSMETAERGASELHNTPSSTLTLNKVSSVQPEAQIRCYCCGEVVTSALLASTSKKHVMDVARVVTCDSFAGRLGGSQHRTSPQTRVMQ